MEKLKDWSSLIEQKMTCFVVVDRLKNAISNVKKKEEAKEEYIIQRKMFRRRIKDELKIQEMKLQMKSKGYKKRDKIVNKERVKLSKLVKTNFDGTSLDWFLFWKEFESEIEKAGIGHVGKFSYPKELLIRREGLLNDGLPFTSESYSIGKSILLGTFGKSTKTTAAYIQYITAMPVIQSSHPNQIQYFEETLVISIHALGTMNKLKELDGYARLTLVKLLIICTDLGRIDEDWQECTSPQYLTH